MMSGIRQRQGAAGMVGGIEFPLWRLAWPFYSTQQAAAFIGVAGTAIALIVLFMNEWAAQPGYRFKLAYWGWIIGVAVTVWCYAAAHILGVLRVARFTGAFDDVKKLLAGFGYDELVQLAPDHFRFQRAQPADGIKLAPTHDYIEVALLFDQIAVNGPLYMLRAIRNQHAR